MLYKFGNSIVITLSGLLTLTCYILSVVLVVVGYIDRHLYVHSGWGVLNPYFIWNGISIINPGSMFFAVTIPCMCIIVTVGFMEIKQEYYQDSLFARR